MPFTLLARRRRFWIKEEVQCRYALISNARHNMMQDNPKEFNQHLLDFFQSIDNSGEGFPKRETAVINDPLE